MKNKHYVLGIDIGNSNTVLGIFRDTKDFDILHHWRITTKTNCTTDELGSIVLSLFLSHKIKPKKINGFIYSSVVPSMNQTLRNMIAIYFPHSFQNILQVSNKISLPLHFDYPRPEEIGADRLVNASAASHIHGGDLIIVDMGTATTFCVIHNGNQYIGGSIAPGLKIALQALGLHAAQLPMIEFKPPLSGVVGRSTIQALESGFFFGWAGLLREILNRIKADNPKRSYKIIATGGLASYINKELPQLFDDVDPLLTLRGLKMIYFRQDN